MDSKHTPGPWAHRNGRIFAADRENLTIASVARSADGDYSPANGDVIAAAPDLLRALEAAVECGMVPKSSASDGGACKHSRQVEVADMIRAAIAKCSGRVEHVMRLTER